MATTTHETRVGPVPRSDRSATVAKLALVALVVLQVFLRLVSPNYWWDDAFWTGLTIILAVVFFAAWFSARRSGALGSTRAYSGLAVVAIFFVLLWI